MESVVGLMFVKLLAVEKGRGLGFDRIVTVKEKDEFRPMLFGSVKKYQFAIYNRWGEIIFQTSDLTKAWDGTVAGVQQDPNVFVWICTYQFEGEDVKTEKGTVMIVR